MTGDPPEPRPASRVLWHAGVVGGVVLLVGGTILVVRIIIGNLFPNVGLPGWNLIANTDRVPWLAVVAFVLALLRLVPYVLKNVRIWRNKDSDPGPYLAAISKGTGGSPTGNRIAMVLLVPVAIIAALFVLVLVTMK